MGKGFVLLQPEVQGELQVGPRRPPVQSWVPCEIQDSLMPCKHEPEESQRYF